MNRFDFFIPLMHYHEYKFIEKNLNKNDVLLEWGSGSGTIYFSGLVKKLISIEHDIDYYNSLKKIIETYGIKNIDLYHVPGIRVKDQKSERHIAFGEYISFPKDRNLKFDKVLIDGRARKYCALSLADYVDDDVLVFIHDFNRNNVEGYEDETYHDDILKHYDIFEIVKEGEGIVALKKKR